MAAKSEASATPQRIGRQAAASQPGLTLAALVGQMRSGIKSSPVDCLHMQADPLLRCRNETGHAAMNSPDFVRRVNTALRPVLGEDQIIVGAQVLRGPSRLTAGLLSATVYLAAAIALAFAYFVASGKPPGNSAIIGFAAAEAVVVIAGLARIFVQRPTLIAITRDQRLVCCRLSGLGKRSAEVAAAPLSRTRISECNYGRRTTRLVCELPGSKPVRLNSIRGHQADLDRVVAVASAPDVPAADGATAPGTEPRPTWQDARREPGRAHRRGEHRGSRRPRHHSK